MELDTRIVYECIMSSYTCGLTAPQMIGVARKLGHGAGLTPQLLYAQRDLSKRLKLAVDHVRQEQGRLITLEDALRQVNPKRRALIEILFACGGNIKEALGEYHESQAGAPEDRRSRMPLERESDEFIRRKGTIYRQD